MNSKTTQDSMQDIPEYGVPISLVLAKKIMDSAEAEAEKNGWSVIIAIVDSGGHLVMLHKLDQAQYGSISVAQLKAETAVNFRRPTKAFEEAVAAGGLGMRILTISNLLAVDGGLPILVDGKVIGAIGVAGMHPTQDAQVAKAGVDAV
jgi:uncharacterized protein GlcG (DUF336 family)